MTYSIAPEMDYHTLRIHDVGPVRFIILTRPEVRNCINMELRRELSHAIRAADSEPRCRATVLAGEGPVFCAGGDIKTLQADPDKGRDRLELAGDMIRAIRQSGTPVVAAVHGGAWGAGLAIAAACDLVVIGRSARLVASFGRFGLVGDSGAFYVLADRVGTGRARELLLLNAALNADEAVSLGLATRAVEDEEVLSTAHTLAKQLAGAGAGANSWTKRILREAKDFEQVLKIEVEAQLDLLAGEHFAQAQEAFSRKELPDWWSDLDHDLPVELLSANR